jgi:diguanylate cyclase (GGDEF)-like protein/PAS domain S-box-containing protein
LAQAKANSDALTSTEFAAMKLIESVPLTEANRLKASLMLHDEAYHQAKASIMRPISIFYGMMDQRTLAAVHAAETAAALVRIVFLSFGVLLLFMLWHVYRSLQATLGCSVAELHKRISQLGSGDFSSSIPVTRGMENSVLGWLSATQKKLARIEAERLDAEAKNQRLTRLYAALSQCNQAIVRCASEAELFPIICRDAVNFGSMKMAWIGLVDEASKTVKPVASYGAGIEYLEGLQISVDADDPSSHGPTGTSIRDNQPFWCQDFRNDPVTALWHERGARSGWGSSASLPLHRKGKVIGTFTLYAGEANAFDEAERNLLVEMAMDVDYALDSYILQSERKQAEKALRESEARTRLIQGETEALLRRNQVLMNTAIDGIHILDIRGNIVEANDAFCRLLGYTREEVAGLNVADWDRNWSADELLERTRKFIQEGSSATFETRHCRKDGTLIDVEVSFSAVEIDGQHYLFCASRDISERKRIQKETETLLRRYQTLMKTALDGFRIIDIQGNVIEANDSFCHMVGYTQEEAIKLNVADWDAQWSKDELLERLRGFIGKKGATFETVHRRKDGMLINVEVSTTGVEIDGQNYFFASSRDITGRKLAEQQIHQLAYYDVLTRLPNRRLLTDRLQQALAVSARNGQHGAVLFLDLDHFKTLNDTKGHDIGDLLLVEVAKRLASCVRDGDTVARLGGDEFVVVLETLSANADDAVTQAETVAEKIRAALNLPYQIEEYTQRSTPSIGIVLFLGHRENLDDLLKHADMAMYQAKTAGRNAIRFYDPAMQAAVDARAEMADELHLALQKQQFCLHCQIQVDSLRRPLGGEMLLRWMHPERGMVMPGQFIPLAEEIGLIVPIGLWVLETACAQLKAWQHDALTRDLTLSVNVSAKQFRQTDFVEQVRRVLLESGARASHLKLELTESTVLENVEDTVVKMNELKLRGVNFSLDDFGTGYSSLQYLKLLPLDQIKIDQSFVRDIASDPNDAAIVQAIIAMTEALGLNVIAEGVETEAQRDFLDKHGCHSFQGYLFSKPVPIEQFEAELKQS